MALCYTLIRSNRRTLALSVDREGALVIRAPRLMPVKQIEAFLTQKERWILEKQAVARQRMEKSQPLTEGSLLPLAKGPLTLRQAEVPFALVDHGTLLLPADVPLAKSLLPWLKEQAREQFSPRVAHWEAITGFHAQSLAFSSAQTRWGSMNSKGTLRLNIALLFCPQDVVDYVIVHELCHIGQMNHSPAFWQTVGKWLPTYQRQRRFLKENHHLIQLLH